MKILFSIIFLSLSLAVLAEEETKAEQDRAKLKESFRDQSIGKRENVRGWDYMMIENQELKKANEEALQKKLESGEIPPIPFIEDLEKQD